MHETLLKNIFATRAASALGLPCVLFSLIFQVAAATAIPTLQYSQDGQNYQPIVVLSGAMKASDYYNYSAHSGHPAFGIAKAVDTVCLYWDSNHDVLSFIFISGGHDHDRATGAVTLTGLPSVSQLTLSDDPGEFKWSREKDTLTGHYSYQNSTDGFVMSGLEAAAFDAKLKLSGTHGVKALRLTVGDPNSGGAFQPLNLHQPLFIRSTESLTSKPGIPVVGAGVPEPTGLGMVALLGTLFLKRPRRVA